MAAAKPRLKPKLESRSSARGGEYTWKLHASERDTVDLIEAVGKRDFAVAYAAATIESPEDQSRIVGLGSDDAVRVWLNGELVHESSTPRAVAVDDDVFPVKLKKGTNRLLIKVANDQGDWGFTFRFLSPELVAKQLFKAADAGDAEIGRSSWRRSGSISMPSRPRELRPRRSPRCAATITWSTSWFQKEPLRRSRSMPPRS